MGHPKRGGNSEIRWVTDEHLPAVLAPTPKICQLHGRRVSRFPSHFELDSACVQARVNFLDERKILGIALHVK